MKAHIIEKKQNHLLEREEIILEVEKNSTPSFAEAGKIASEELKKSEELIKIKKIEGIFGTTKFKIYANVYLSKERMEKIEPKKKEKKTGEEK